MTRALLLTLLLIAVGVRVVYFVQYQSDNPASTVQVADCKFYDEWAQRIAGGELVGEQAFYQPPLYPYLLGGLYACLNAIGAGSERFAVVYAIQLALGVVSLLLVFSIGRRLFGDVAGLIAVSLCLLYGNLMFWEVKLLATTLDVLLGLLAVRVLIGAEGRARSFALAGLFVGLLCLTRADKLLFAGAVGLWILFDSHRPWRRRAGLAGAFALPLAALLGLSMAHNQVAAGDRTLVSANGGINFYFGNHDGASGINMSPDAEIASLDDQRPVAKKRAQAARKRELTDHEVSSYWMGEGLRYIRSDFAGWCALEWRKMQLAISDLEADIGWSMRAEEKYASVLSWLRLPFSWLLALGLAGVLLRFLDRPAGVWLLVGFVLATYVVLTLFFMGARFRLGSAPMLAILAGGAITGVRVAWRSGAFLRLPSAALVLMVLPWVGGRVAREHVAPGHTLPMRDLLDANAAQILGQAHMQREELSAAKAAFQRVVELDPASFKGWFALGLVASEQEKRMESLPDLAGERQRLRQEAEVALLRSRQFMSSFSRTHLLLGQLCLDPEEHRARDAVIHLQMALRLERNRDTQKWYAKALIEDGQYAKARVELESMHPNARKADPEIADLRRRVGLPE